MKFTVERAAFLDAISRLSKVVGNKSSLPVLEGILLSAKQGTLSMSAYNLEMGMQKEIYASCEESGEIVISANLLSNIIRRLNGPQVEIETDERLMCHIKCNEALFDIMGMAASDFPEMPSVDEGTKLTIDSEVFSSMVKGTIFAVAQIEGTRPILTGINISVKNNVLQFVSIDGFRLAIRREKIDECDDIEFVVAGKAVNEFVKLIDENSESIELTVGNRLISFSVNGYVFISRLLDGEFVNYEKIIPTEYKQKVILNLSELISTLECVSIIINDTLSTPVRCAFDENKLSLTCMTAIGKSSEKINISLEGEPFEIGMNSKYFLDALKVCQTGEIMLTFNGENSGVLIKSADENNNDFLYLVMPMRLKK